MHTELITAAGVTATGLFVCGTCPMLLKALRTRNLSSYSGANLAIANVANAAQTVRLTSIAFGPVWMLHRFNTLASTLMLLLWLPRSNRTTSTPSDVARPDGLDSLKTEPPPSTRHGAIAGSGLPPLWRRERLRPVADPVLQAPRRPVRRE